MEFNFNLEFEKMMNNAKVDTVIVMGHMNADGDSVGSVMGISHYIRVNYPQYKVIPYLTDNMDKGAKIQILEDQVFKPTEKPNVKDYAAIICDTATLKRLIGIEYYENAVSSMVIDHHAANENYGDVNFVKISEACAENVFWSLDEGCLEKAAKEQYPNAADYIYLGIIHDTNAFARTNPGIFEAALKLLKMGVDHKKIMKTLNSTSYEELKRRNTILETAKRILDGKVAYVYFTNEQINEKGIGYEDIHPIGEILRDCEDIELGFSMFEESPDTWRCSFRSDGQWINVNELLIPFGGGGHVAAAGLRYKTTDGNKLLEKIVKRICEMKAE